MQYIILDMEWNQAWPGSSAARQPLPSPIRGEIVQIGAVLTPFRQVCRSPNGFPLGGSCHRR